MLDFSVCPSDIYYHCSLFCALYTLKPEQTVLSFMFFLIITFSLVVLNATGILLGVQFFSAKQNSASTF
jgi:hypothetical protein